MESQERSAQDSYTSTATFTPTWARWSKHAFPAVPQAPLGCFLAARIRRNMMFLNCNHMRTRVRQTFFARPPGGGIA
eukprot:1334265-Pyramimonas_sp.AAC.1